MRIKIEHFYNENAVGLLRSSKARIGASVPKTLSDWIAGAGFHKGYFLGPRDPEDSIDLQIANAGKYLDEFSIEATLKKIHLEDCLRNNHTYDDILSVYHRVVEYFSRYILLNGITNTMLIWLSDDALKTGIDFPSQTMSFGFPRTEEDFYYLNVDSFVDVAMVATRVDLARQK